MTSVTRRRSRARVSDRLTRAPAPVPAWPDGMRRRRLLRAARRGDRGARDRLISVHLGLVRSVAARYRDYGMPFDDLVQEGSLGLLEAIDGYDPNRGPDFEAYARFRVRRAIRNALTEQARLIRLPKQVVERRRALARAEARLVAAGQKPTANELAAATGLSEAAVRDARASGAAPISLESPRSAERRPLETWLIDHAAADPEAETLAHERSAALRGALAKLSERERHIITAQWGLDGGRPATGVELAEELQLSPRRTHTIGQGALYELREALEPRQDAMLASCRRR